MKNKLTILFLLFAVSCARAAPQGSQSEDFVATFAAQTLTAYPAPSVEDTRMPTMDPAQGPSVEITQEPGEQTSAAELPDGTLPDSHYIWDIWGHRQYFGLGCEASAVVDWAAYFDVTISEFLFQTRLPLSDNPDLGFVGSVEGPWGQVPPYAYGVHAAPVAELLRRQYGMNAIGEKNLTINDLKRELASGEPVIAWVM